MDAPIDRYVQTVLLLDCYGSLLTERQHTLLHKRFEEDLSLAEIVADEGISRQAAQDAIHRGEQQLYAYEARLGFLARQQHQRAVLARCRDLLAQGANAQALALLDALLSDEGEDEHGGRALRGTDG